MQRVLIVSLFLIVGAVTSAWSQVAAGPACDVSPDLTTPTAPLTQVASALNKGSLDVLALGSGSTVGETGGGGNPALAYHLQEQSFPYRMVDGLREMKPGLRVTLTVEGGRNMTADAMLPLLRNALAARHFDLVLWQTGTVEAVEGLRPDVLHGVLQDGADAVEEAHADLVLIDPQFSRFLRANADLSPYETVLVQMTATSPVTLFHRYDLTEGWVTSGQIDLERVSRDQRDATVALLNDCLGRALAHYVLAGAAER